MHGLRSKKKPVAAALILMFFGEDIDVLGRASMKSLDPQNLPPLVEF